jgi:ribosomal protein L12E/L44/L45/RPP1/RPP2
MQSQAQADRRAEVERRRAVRLEERTVEEQLEEINNPPVPVPTQEEADILKSGETHAAREAREKQERDMKPEDRAGYKTR